MDKEENQATLVIEEADKEMSHSDMDFIVSLITEWLIRDYLQNKTTKNLTKSK